MDRIRGAAAVPTAATNSMDGRMTMARAMSITKVREYFKSAPYDEAEVVLTLVQKDMAERNKVTSQPVLPFHKKPRTRRKKAAGEPAPHPADQAAVGGSELSQ